jgi:adenine-specific DNA methylase
VALRLLPDRDEKRIAFDIIQDASAKHVGNGTVQRGSATCPVCGYTTPVASVRTQLKGRRGGTADARMTCVVTTRSGQQGRFYRLPTERDHAAVAKARSEIEKRQRSHRGPLSLLPDESLDLRGIRHTWVMIYGPDRWRDLFTPRQALALATVSALVSNRTLEDSPSERPIETAVRTCLGLSLGRLADSCSSLVTWTAGGEFQGHTFTR